MKNVLLVLLFAYTGLATAQTAMTNSLRDDINTKGFDPSPYRIIYGIPQEAGSVQGDVYLDDDWQVANVWFYPEVVALYDPKAADKVSGLPVRLDLGNQYVEFKLPEGVKAIEASSVKKMELQGDGRVHTFINAKHYGEAAAQMPGFVETLSDGKITVVKHTKLWVKQPTYSAALNVGERDAKLIKQKAYYLVIHNNDNTYTLEKFKPGTGSLKKLMKSKFKKVETYMNEKQLDPKNDQDLAKILAYYNSLA